MKNHTLKDCNTEAESKTGSRKDGRPPGGRSFVAREFIPSPCPPCSPWFGPLGCGRRPRWVSQRASAVPFLRSLGASVVKILSGGVVSPGETGGWVTENIRVKLYCC